MLRKPHWWAGLLATLVVTALVASARADAVRYFPNDTEVVVVLDLQQIFSSELMKGKKDLLDQLKGGLNEKVPPDVKKWIDASGFDLFRDLGSITIASPGGKDPEKGIVVITGKFDTKKIKEVGDKAAREFGDVIKANKAGKHTVYEISPPGGNKSAYVVLVDEKTLVMAGSMDVATEAIARAGGKKGKLPRELAQLLETSDAKQSFAMYATSAGLQKIIEETNNPQAAVAAEGLKQIDGVSAGITLTKDINFQMGVAAKGVDAAKQLALLANAAVLPAIRKQAEAKANEDERFGLLNDVVKTLKIDANGSAVTLRGRITAAVLEKAIKLIPGLGGN